MKKRTMSLIGITICSFLLIACGKGDRGETNQVLDDMFDEEEYTYIEDEDPDEYYEEEYYEEEYEEYEEYEDSGLSEDEKYSNYSSGLYHYNNMEYEEAINYFEQVKDYKDADRYLEEAKYRSACITLFEGNLDLGYQMFEELGDYRNAKNLKVSDDFLEKFNIRYPNGVNNFPEYYGQWVSDNGDRVELTELYFNQTPYCFIQSNRITDYYITKYIEVGDHYEMGYAANPNEVVFELISVPQKNKEDKLVLIYNNTEYYLDTSVAPKYDLTGNLVSDNGTPLSDYTYYISGDYQLVLTGVKDTSIKSAYVPAYFAPFSVKELDHTFMDCTELEEVTIDNGIERLDSTFLRCAKLSEVNIPESVIYMKSTFYDCHGLERVILPSRVKSLERVFYDCKSLKEIDIPESVEYLSCAFSGCSSLETLTLPASLTNTDLGYNIFEENLSLKTLNINSSFIPNLYADDLPVLENINLGSNYYEIRENQFENIPLKNINMDKATITSISVNAFAGTKLESITLPASVWSVSPDAFFNCENLKHIEVDKNNENFVAEDGVLYNKDKTQIFIYPAGNESDTYVMPDSVVDIISGTNGLFYGNRYLENVTISSNLNILWANSFELCENLKNVTVKSSAAMGASPGVDYFKDCKNVVTLYGYKGSTAEVYSQLKDRNCIFEEIQ